MLQNPKPLTRSLAAFIGLPLIAALSVAGSAVPVAAEPGHDSDVVAIDVDTGEELLPIVSRTRAAGDGYAFFEFAGGALTSNLGTYTVRLVASPGIEGLREAVQGAVDDVNAQHGAKLTFAPDVVPASGAPASMVAARGEILVIVDDTMCPTAAGCASPGVQYIGSEYHAVSGRAWITQRVLLYTPAQRKHVIAHELGHTLGLAHYDQQHQGRAQLMHASSYDATEPRAGDIAGLRSLGTPKLLGPATLAGFFRDLLGRTATAAELDQFTREYATRGPDAVAKQLVESAEHRMVVVDRSYRVALGRVPTGAELAQQLGAMAGGGTERTLLTALWSSNEAFAAAGNTNASWVASVLRGALGRDGSPAELAASVADAERSGRMTAVTRILSSPDYASAYLDAQYGRLFTLPVSALGISMWAPYVQRGDWEELTRQLLTTFTYEKVVLARYGL